MKLRNKKTGEIVDTLCRDDITKGLAFGVDWHDGNPTMVYYNSLAELNEEWEDVLEEPDEWWYIDRDGVVGSERRLEDSGYNAKQIGNYFGTEEEARKAVDKIKAFKRLKDKGFRFGGWEDLQAKMGLDELMLFNRDVIDTDNVIGFRIDDYHDCIKDLDTCFGGEE